jgi:retinol dehydrogenase 12
MPAYPSQSSLSGRVVLITGANTGIGQVTASTLAQRGAEVYIACRAREAGEATLGRIRAAGGNAHLLSLDLGDLASVRACADDFLSRGKPLHVLINNAGVAGAKGLTKSGFELAFGVNHVGHFLLTQLLLPRLREADRARVVTVASKAHYDAKAIDWDAVRRPTRGTFGLPEYQVSKLANVLFSAELARRLSGSNVTSYALHPGVIASDVWRSVPQPFRALILLPMKSVEQGAANSIYLASSPDVAGKTGLYYHDNSARAPSAVAQDPALAKELWSRSEAWTR